jgi:hypothetical protein
MVVFSIISLRCAAGSSTVCTASPHGATCGNSRGIETAQAEATRVLKERGVHFGPKKKLTPEHITELQGRREQGAFIKTLMRDYCISKVSVYRSLAQTDSSPSARNG